MENFTEYERIEFERLNKIKRIVVDIFNLIQDNNLTFQDAKKVLSATTNLLDKIMNKTIVNSNIPKIQEMVQSEVEKQVLGYHVYQALSAEN